MAALPAGADHPAGTNPVPLHTADSFAVLAGSTITNTGSTTITGDVGLHPGTAVTGFGPGADSVTLLGGGTTHIDDAVALQAKSDLVTAYNDAAGRGPATLVPVELGDVSRGGLPLTAGVYTSPTFGLTGTLTLDAEGDPDAQFVFQATLSTLITASNSRVLLINDAQACHVVWQVTSSATFGTGTQFVGDVLALTSITATTAATFQGRLLARNGAVTLDTNTITRSTCASTTGGTSSTSTTTGGTATTSPSATPGPTSGGGGTAPAGGSPAGAPGSPGATPGGPSGGDSSTASSRPSLPVTGTPDAELTALGLALLTLGILMLGAERRARTA